MSLQIDPSQLTTEQRRDGLRKMVLIHLRRLGGRATSDEVAESIRHTTGRNVDVPPRMNELMRLCFVRDTGLRSRTKGRPKIVWATLETHFQNDQLFVDEDVQPVAPSWWERYGQ